jgi:hypothetical protein
MNTMIEGPEKRKKRVVIFLSIFFALAAVLGAGYIFIRETPRYSLYWFKKAILERDAESALKYLDIDNIVDNMVKDMPGEEEKEKTQSKNRSEGPMKNIGKDIIMQNLPAIKVQLREQLKSAIISYSNKTTLDNLNNASVFGLQISMEGNDALVKIRGKDKVAFKMAKSSEGYWRIIALNLKELTALGGK